MYKPEEKHFEFVCIIPFKVNLQAPDNLSVWKPLIYVINASAYYVINSIPICNQMTALVIMH